MTTERFTAAGTVLDGGTAPDPVLTGIDVALFHLRRVWAKPDLMKRIRAQNPCGPGARPLQLSNLMVVHAVHELTATGPPAEVTVGAVADALDVDPSTASRLVTHAIDAGLVSRRPSPVDARRANLGLTDTGRRVKDVADRFRRGYLDTLMAGWTDAERTAFARLLTRFADTAARVPMDPDGVLRIFEEAGARHAPC
ncbi:MarR family winged helix-turn-helix transcriptional regulator [Spirillospora albida]|uniref:MarR family winged helix-turn-helix transcriptional regulator n=1 Tax=Spirillospora albida TaxID=58123 RepID=UPI00068E1662|nr:MarR family winged helix-turn-helix transcriptional regulator [Spirillospora albida]